MNKILSILLSISLIYGSITPSLAQGNTMVTGIRAVRTALKPTLSAQARKVLQKTATSVMLPNRWLAAGLRTTAVGTAHLPGTATLNQRVTQGVQAQIQAGNELVDFSKIAFTDAQALETVQNFITAPLASKPQLLLNGVPQMHIVSGHPVSEGQITQAVGYYRRALDTALKHPLNDATRAVLQDQWARQMAAVSNLGLYGTAEDAELIIKIADNAPAFLAPYTDVITARTLLSLEAYAPLEEFAAARAVTKNNVTQLGAHWQGIADYAKTNALGINLPQVAKGKMPGMPAEVTDSLRQWNALNAYHADCSANATGDWLALRENASFIIPDETAAAASAGNVTAPSLQNALKINTPAVESLELGATEVPLSAAAANPGVGGPTAPAPLTGVSAAMPAGANPTVPAFKKKSGFFSRFTEVFKTGSANSTAKRILSQKYPLPSFLKQIIESHAADKWKEEAFVRLYEQNALQKILEGLPEATLEKIPVWYANGELGARLLGLYNDGIIYDGVSAISNAKEQQSLLAYLDKLINSEEWAAKAKIAYDQVSVLHSDFSGVVPPVPTVDKQEIEATFRPQNWAEHMSEQGVERNGMIYFKNQIPFYYRNSKGQLSSKPVGVLSQEQANLYGKILSSLHLAGQPGMSIPQGFVLALDEMGQWKLVMPNGNRAIVEANPKSKKLLEEIHKNGSKQVAVDTPYSTSDLLAMANLLEHNPDLNLELLMGAPHSLNLFLKVLGSYIGLDSAGALTGPFKATLKGLQGVANLMGNLVSGVGYMSPWAGGAAQGLMTKAGSVRTLQFLFGASMLGLGYSLFGLGMTGFQSAEALKSIPLLLMALPMVTAVFAGSLLGTQMNVFLNYFKDPVARTGAHLGFAETKQWSRLGLVASTALLGALFGVNWSVVVPAALTLVGVSGALLYNTPVYREFKAAQAAAKTKAEQERARLAALTPEQQAEEAAARAKKLQLQKADMKLFEKLYKNIFRSKAEVKDISFRVRSVYASYAASLMMLGQTSTALLGPSGGQALVGAFMLSTALMRRFASKQVSSNKMTDNQLTGMSLPLLALTAAGLTVAPTAGMLGLALFGVLGIGHYVATAVPGQLDAARLQNLVSAEMSKRKQAVTDYASMTPEQQEAVQANWDEMDQLVFAKPTTEERLKLLEEIEKSWASKASRDYSYFNGNGLIGIGAAAGAGYLFADLGPQWAQNLLDTVGSFLGDKTSLITLNRLVLAYSTGVASWLAWKNRGLTKDFFSLFSKKKVTADTIAAGQVTPQDFGFTAETAERQLVGVRKNLKKVEDQLVNYGVNSERKLTKHLQELIKAHNRFAAAYALEKEAGATEMSSALRADFTHLQSVFQKYKALLDTSDPSIMLKREFESLANALCQDGIALQVLRTDIAYMPEGAYTLPAEYAKYEDASQLVAELDQLAGQIMSGTVTKETYRLFITYQTRVNELFAEYKKANPADSSRVLQQQEKLNAIISGLKRADAHHNILELNAKTTSAQDIQELRDVLAGYAN